ncbi:MAG: hypothetical protein V1856_03265, partial [Candidatus Liptonbacteria bacterium]
KLYIVASSSASTGFAMMVVQPVTTTTNDSPYTTMTPLFVIRNDARIGLGGAISAPGNDGARVVIHGPLVRVLGTLQPDALTGTLAAGNISSGFFGSNTGGGNYSFPAKLSIGTSTAPSTTQSLYVVGNIGIGTSTPAVKLVISGGTNQVMDVGGGRIQGLNLTPTADSEAVPRKYLHDNFQAIYWNLASGTVYPTNTSYGVAVGGTSSSSYKLNITGTAYISSALTVVGSANLNGGAGLNNQNITGVNKLTVTTIDPIYRIRGVNYATYAGSFAGGVKEEYSGKGRLAARTDLPAGRQARMDANAEGEYEYAIDFSKESIGSDLWVWFRAVDFTKENIEAVATPYGQSANIWYEIVDSSDSNSNSSPKIVFHGDKAVEFSFRLTGKRVDWRKWPTRAVDQSERPSFILD